MSMIRATRTVRATGDVTEWEAMNESECSTSDSLGTVCQRLSPASMRKQWGTWQDLQGVGVALTSAALAYLGDAEVVARVKAGRVESVAIVANGGAVEYRNATEAINDMMDRAGVAQEVG